MVEERLRLETLCKKAESLETGPDKRDALLKVYNIDIERFNYELSKWVVDNNNIFEEFMIKSMPLPPEEMVNYYNLSDYEKRKTTDAFWHQTIVQEYLDKKLLIKRQNLENFEWALKLFSYIPEHDSFRRSKLKDRLEKMKIDLEKSGINVLFDEDNDNIISPPSEWI